jgi:diguanylate cyclase (GGDEF)-like protein/PAS domain S-box-containing protein
VSSKAAAIDMKAQEARFASQERSPIHRTLAAEPASASLAEQRLHRASRSHRVLAECSHALVRATAELQLLEQMCRILVETGGYVQARVDYVPGNSDNRMRTVAYAGCEDDFRSVMHIPLEVEGERIGEFALYAREAEAFDGDEIALIETLTDDIVFGIASLRREAARAQAEASLRRLVRARRVMAECSRVLVHATDERDMLAQMCHILVESGGYRQGWIGLATDNATVPVQPVAYAGYGDDAPMTTDVNWSRQGNYLGLAGEAITSGDIRIARNILQDPAHGRKRRRAFQLGYQSSIALPLKSAEGIVGVLVVHAAEADAFDDDELALLSNLADDVGFGISSLRVRIKHREAEEQRRVGERRLRETFEQAAVGIMRVDLEGILVDANQKLCDMLGYTKDELLGKRVRDITHPDDYGAGSRFRQCGGSTGTLAGEKRYLRKDGSVLWGRRTMSVATDDAGNPHQFISIVEDITHSKELERRFELTFDHAPLGMALIGLDGRYLQVNRALLQMLGCEADDLIGKPLSELSEADGVQDVAEDEDAHYRRQMLDGKFAAHSSESELVRKDGSSAWATRTISLVRSASGEPQYFILVVADMSERKEALETIARERALLRAVVDAVPERIYVKDREGRMLLHNTANIKAHGASCLEDLLGKTVFELFPPETARRIDAEDRGIMTTGRPVLDRERAAPDENGEMRWISSSKVPLTDASGTIVGIVGVNRDITERKRMERELTVSEQTLRATFTHARVGITVIALDLTYVEVNQQYCDIVGYSREELTGRMKMTAVCGPESLAETEAACRRLLAREAESDSREQRLLRRNGSTVWVVSAISLVRDADGNAKHFVSVTQDITESKVAEERLLQLAHYDTLTGLPNRSLFNHKVRESLAQAQSWRTGVMFIDVDRFKTVNDTLGHLEGDKLLKQISERLTRAVRRGDTVGRLGGDEFAVVLANLASDHDAGIVAQKIIASLHSPFPLAGREIYVSASIGIALHPDHGPDQDTLIKNADAAMYEAKKRGRNGFQFYTPELNARSDELLTFENDLRRALEREEFVVHYQPKSCIATGEITGLEALLRWEHPAQGLVSPRDFIPLLEDTGLIVPVGEWVLEHVCMQLARWQQDRIPLVPVSINISAHQFNSPHLAENFRRILSKRGTAPHLLELELTESALMVNTHEATRMLDELKRLGLRLSIDDFGTGYSSLAYLKRFPLDTLKIDQSFVKDIAEDQDDRAITLAVISMAHSLGLSVVAEGVETPEQMEFLRQHGCDQLQGYYLAQPMSPAVCAAWLKARKPS